MTGCRQQLEVVVVRQGKHYDDRFYGEGRLAPALTGFYVRF
jgi:hypothetical protein